MSLADVQRLRAFGLVLDLGSISAAAAVLGYTQSAVSQQLAALEREVGSALVDRSQRPLRATAAGEVLRPHVARVLAAVGGAEAALDELRGGARRLRLAAFTSALSSFVPAAVRDLRRTPPRDASGRWWNTSAPRPASRRGLPTSSTTCPPCRRSWPPGSASCPCMGSRSPPSRAGPPPVRSPSVPPAAARSRRSRRSPRTTRWSMSCTGTWRSLPVHTRRGEAAPRAIADAAPRRPRARACHR